MKLYNSIFFILFAFFPLLSFSSTALEKHEKTKTITKNYPVNKDATVFIDNRYGNVTVTTWHKNTVNIIVKITVKGNDLESIEDKLKAISINFEANKDLVEARTKIEKVKSNWSWWGKNSNVNYEINYFINMPRTNNADLNNKYGDIELDELEGKANIDCDYGNIEIEKLLNTTNTIDIDYCGNSEINYMNSGTINADYSKLTIDNATTLKTNIDYTTLRIRQVENLTFSSDYGNVTVDDVTHVVGSSDYAGMRFGTVRKNLEIDTDYGGLRIRNLAKGFEKVKIDGSYAGIKIETPGNATFNFVIDLSYASFGYPDEKVKFIKSIKKTTKKHYEGSFGDGTSESQLNIKSSYGSVSIRVKD
mgnify:CR=1 FL=1